MAGLMTWPVPGDEGLHVPTCLQDLAKVKKSCIKPLQVLRGRRACGVKFPKAELGNLWTVVQGTKDQNSAEQIPVRGSWYGSDYPQSRRSIFGLQIA